MYLMSPSAFFVNSMFAIQIVEQEEAVSSMSLTRLRGDESMDVL